MVLKQNMVYPGTRLKASGMDDRQAVAKPHYLQSPPQEGKLTFGILAARGLPRRLVVIIIVFVVIFFDNTVV